MKRRIFRGLVTALSLLIAPATFAATSIGVNFQGRDGTQASPYPGTPPLASADVAGVVPQANWNNVDDANAFTPAENGTTGPLVDSTGAATTVTLTFAANDSWYNDVDPTNIVTANAKLMNGIIKAGGGLGVTERFRFDGLSDGRYDVYVYMNENGDDTALDISDGNILTTYHVIETHQFYDTNTFILASNTNPSGTRDVGNYVKLGDVATYGATSLGVVVTHISGSDGCGVAGLQLVNLGGPVVNTNEVHVTSQPVSRRVVAGSTVTFTVNKSGPGAFQWYKNNSPIQGASGGITNMPTLTYTTPLLTAGDDGASFHVVVSNNVNNATSDDAVITIGNLILVPGAKQEYWSQATLGVTGTPTRDIVEDPNFSTPPDSILALPNFETPDEQGSDYLNRVSALFKPPVTGDYVFFVASDDDSDFFISTDSTPAKKYLIAQESGYSGDRHCTAADGAGTGLSAAQSAAQKRSDKWIPDPVNDPTAIPPFANGIHLTNGLNYYIEAVHHEGGGGDNLAVTFKLKSDPDPAPGDATGLGSFFGTLAPYVQVMDGGYITVTNFPSTVTGLQSRAATLTIGVTSGYVGDLSGAGPAPLSYLWQSAPAGSSTFTNVLSAAGASFTTPLLKLSDNGAQFRVVVTAAGVTTNSSTATLAVTPDITPPRPVQVTLVKAGFKEVTLTFDELMDKTSAETGANYVFSPGNVAGASASLAADGTTVTVTTGTALTPNVTNVLAITGVKDLAGNAVAPNTTISFIFQSVTYEADILFDGPLAYYRFEDAVGAAVAKNTGSTGGDGAYYTGDESGPGAGDAMPSSAKGDPGPRPPTFAGFETANHSAAFDGVGEWVDTKNQYLQDRGAFTLEYWVAPADRVNQANRIGIVGQNDAIEYGFITPDTIQIWTPADSLNTAYTNADNEWHHVATIASGTSIKTYYDGVLQGSTSVTTADYGSSIYNVHIGGGGVFDATGNWFNGHIDEVAVFDKAIPAARVAEHFNAGKNGGVLTTSGAVTPPLSSNIALSLARSGNTLTISWTPAGGTLESTAVLNGASSVWSDAGTANPATITIGTGNSFYRVKQ
ncbi:MAG: hypothetical protein E6L09_03715 [Verrucomicrobia bacterium]|nr:MAG: hypothetical protein E6L09_03715 [Verrucomicrobiota bacterium]